MPDESTYGFNKDDADEIVSKLGIGEGSFPEGKARGGIRLFRFTLNESLADGTADADILWMDGTDTGLDATIYDPEGIFAALTTVGDSGLCLLQGDRYYVIQAGC